MSVMKSTAQQVWLQATNAEKGITASLAARNSAPVIKLATALQVVGYALDTLDARSIIKDTVAITLEDGSEVTPAQAFECFTKMILGIGNVSTLQRKGSETEVVKEFDALLKHAAGSGFEPLQHAAAVTNMVVEK